MEDIMDIKPKDVDTIETVGSLHNDDVKMIRTTGGFWIAIGKKEKGSRTPQALAAGNHPGIVMHEVSKRYSDKFKPSVNKSENNMAKVESHNNLLTKSAKKDDIQLISSQNNNELEFILYKNGITIGKYETEIEGATLLVKSWEFNNELKGNEEMVESISNLINNKMEEFALYKIQIKK